MIRATIELVPFGDETRKRTLHVIEVWNNTIAARQSDTHGDYSYRISRKVGKAGFGKPAWTMSGRIVRFPRKAKNSVHLLRAILNDAYGEK